VQGVVDDSEPCLSAVNFPVSQWNGVAEKVISALGRKIGNLMDMTDKALAFLPP
jgi:hypothetical protein